MTGDVLSVEDDNPEGEPLIHQVMREGKRIPPSPTVEEIRAYAARRLRSLPAPLGKLEPETTYPMKVGDALKDLAAAAVDRRLRKNERNPK